ncbi:hypothetical protein K1719_012663 [Acacia pycnantha]|nr:hypothetical protein K1719_012663 [Acacia pycnantha]
MSHSEKPDSELGLDALRERFSRILPVHLDRFLGAMGATRSRKDPILVRTTTPVSFVPAESDPTAAESLRFGGNARNFKPGYARSDAETTPPLIYSGQISSVTSPALNVLPTGNICPSGKILKTGMASNQTTRTDSDSTREKISDASFSPQSLRMNF